MILLTVMYPVQPNSEFDMDYYLNSHIRMVADRWGTMGMQGAQIARGLSGADPESPATYQIIAMVQFESLDALQNAFAAYGEEIFGDVPSFTDVSPVVQINEIIG